MIIEKRGLYFALNQFLKQIKTEWPPLPEMNLYYSKVAKKPI